MMGEWKASVTIRILPSLRTELIKFAEKEHRSLGNYQKPLRPLSTYKVPVICLVYYAAVQKFLTSRSECTQQYRRKHEHIRSSRRCSCDVFRCSSCGDTGGCGQSLAHRKLGLKFAPNWSGSTTPGPSAGSGQFSAIKENHEDEVQNQANQDQQRRRS